MNFINKNFLSLCLLLCFVISISTAQSQNRDIYELKIYYLDNQQQEDRIDSYLKEAYIPALHQSGVKKVGAFKPIEGDSLFGKRVFVLTTYQSAEQLFKTPEALEKDKKYLSAGKAYIEAPHDNPPYQRIETIVMKAFEGMPQLKTPDFTNAPEERVYELRSYEGATEKLFRNKVDMFNEGEIDIFNKLEFNPVFFGEVVSGSNMPNLMYMAAFKDKASRDSHWETFVADPDWKKMSSMKEYQNNVSHMDIYLLHPTSYSDF